MRDFLVYCIVINVANKMEYESLILSGSSNALDELTKMNNIRCLIRKTTIFPFRLTERIKWKFKLIHTIKDARKGNKKQVKL